ncbi:MAG TPA: fused MFS/spermidine synthase [Vicinamibacterales bacterium]|nr:fused MFS/spermidine synthase [Vicinamibacterales bacterium]
MPEELALPAIFFLSGAAGLIFEMVWLYRCGLVFGNTVWAASITIASFMAGLAAGNALISQLGDRIRRPLRAYAAAEFIVAIGGVALAYGLASATALVGPASRFAADEFWAPNALRLGITFVALLAPATAMGTALPLLAGELSGELSGPRDRFGVLFGRLYGWNTLGAVCGAIGAELVLIRAIGVTGSAWFAAALDCVAGAAALWLAREPRLESSRAPRPAAARATPGPLVRLLTAAGFAGANLLALEVVWLRFLSMYVLTTTLAMSVILAVVLAAIGTGGLAASRWLARRRPPAADVTTVALAAGCSVVASYAAFGQLTSGTQVGDWRRMVWFATVLAAPTSLLSGVMFTLLGERIAHHVDRSDRAAARLSLANAIGAVCGPLLASFVLLPTMGMERTLFVVAAAYGVAAFLTVDFTGRAWRSWLAVRTPARVTALLAFAAALLLFPFGLMRRTYFARAAAPYAADGSQVVAVREGTSDTLFLMRQTWMGEPVYDRLVTNGFSMSGTAIPALRYMRMFVYLPMLLHESPLRRVLVVCYGAGVTAGAATDLPSVDAIHVAEISRDIVAMSDLIYPRDRRPLGDARVRLHVEDGRYLLETTRERFDLITGEPPPPRTPGAVNIYTREYFRLVYDHLDEGGITTYWLPVARPEPGTDVDTIARGFCDVFADCSLWNATPFDLLLVGTRHAAGPAPAAAMAAAWATVPLAGHLREIGFERPEQLAATFLGDATFVRQLTAGTPPLTDAYPQRLRPDPARASLSDPRYAFDPSVAERYRYVLDPARARQAFEASPFIRRLLSPALVAGALPRFDDQRSVNRVLWEGGRPLRLIDDIDAILTRTTWRALPLWMLGTDEVKQRIAMAHDDGTGASQYARGLDRLAARDYLGAASQFAAAEQRGFRGVTLRPLLVYALSRGGNSAGAARLARGVAPSDPEEAQFWRWMRARLGTSPANTALR